METNKMESFLSGNEMKLYSFNQARDEINRRLGEAFSLGTFAEFLNKSGVRPQFISASKVGTGLYSEANLDALQAKIEAGEVAKKRRKREEITISAEDYALLQQLKSERTQE